MHLTDLALCTSYMFQIFQIFLERSYILSLDMFPGMTEMLECLYNQKAIILTKDL